MTTYLLELPIFSGNSGIRTIKVLTPSGERLTTKRLFLDNDIFFALGNLEHQM